LLEGKAQLQLGEQSFELVTTLLQPGMTLVLRDGDDSWELFRQKYGEDWKTTVQWAGDLDRDGQLDLIVVSSWADRDRTRNGRGPNRKYRLHTYLSSLRTEGPVAEAPPFYWTMYESFGFRPEMRVEGQLGD
jgi:hypothetical protein